MSWKWHLAQNLPMVVAFIIWGFIAPDLEWWREIPMALVVILAVEVAEDIRASGKNSYRKRLEEARRLEIMADLGKAGVKPPILDKRWQS